MPDYTANYTISLGDRIIREREIILDKPREDAKRIAEKRKEELSREHVGAEVTLVSLVEVA